MRDIVAQIFNDWSKLREKSETSRVLTSEQVDAIMYSCNRWSSVPAVGPNCFRCVFEDERSIVIYKTGQSAYLKDVSMGIQKVKALDPSMHRSYVEGIWGDYEREKGETK